jgi:hypothetical protein
MRLQKYQHLSQPFGFSLLDVTMADLDMAIFVQALKTKEGYIL